MVLCQVDARDDVDEPTLSDDPRRLIPTGRCRSTELVSSSSFNPQSVTVGLRLGLKAAGVCFIPITLPVVLSLVWRGHAPGAAGEGDLEAGRGRAWNGVVATNRGRAGVEGWVLSGTAVVEFPPISPVVVP